MSNDKFFLPTSTKNNYGTANTNSNRIETVTNTLSNQKKRNYLFVLYILSI